MPVTNSSSHIFPTNPARRPSRRTGDQLQNNPKYIMKKQLTLALAMACIFGVASLFAADKEQTVTGKGMCAKCALKETEKCQNAIQVAGKAGKVTTYYLTENQVSKDFHGQVCKKTVEGVTVTGSVKTENGKKVLTASKIAAAK